jgi:hypothetical protein
MNLEDLTDVQTTTKKMRKAVQRGDVKNEKDRQSKRKNPDPNPKFTQPEDGPKDLEDQLDPATAFQDE